MRKVDVDAVVKEIVRGEIVVVDDCIWQTRLPFFSDP
jgi:hypothetical protein